MRSGPRSVLVDFRELSTRAKACAYWFALPRDALQRVSCISTDATDLELTTELEHEILDQPKHPGDVPVARLYEVL